MRKANPELDLDTWDDEYEQREEDVQFAKVREKGAPKKKRSAAGE